MDQSEVWDEIANSWHHLRQKTFQPVTDFKERYKVKKGRILEIGCGNARNLLPFTNLECHGIDFSQRMIDKAKEYSKKHKLKINVKKADMRDLPYKDNHFDYVLHIASLHHLKSEEGLLRAIEEAQRVVKKEGIILLTVWNKLQLKFLLKSKDTYIPWSVRGKKYNRFYHLFDYLELKKLIKKTNLNILESNILGKNLVFILKKN